MAQTRGGRRLRGWVAALVVLCLLAIAVLAGRQAIARFVIERAVAAVAHVRVSIGSSTVGLSGATLHDVRVRSLAGEPIAKIGSLSLRYDLRALFGGKRLFGLERVEVDSPHLTIVRHADETYNVPIPKLPPKNAKPGAPLIATIVVRDGSIDVVDRSRTGSPVPLYARDVTLDADVSTAALSRYAMRLTYGENLGRMHPVRGAGRIDMRDKFSDQRWSAAVLPVAGAVDFATNSAALRLTAGTLHDAQLWIFNLPAARGMQQIHLGGTGDFDGGAARVAGLAKPIEAIAGRLDVTDRGMLTPLAYATIGGVRVRARGGAIDLTNPHVRFSIEGRGDLARMRAILPQARRLPVSGPLSFSMLAEGSLTKPEIFISARSPRIDYNEQIVTGTRATIAVDQHEADVLAATTHRGAIGIAARGRIAFRSKPDAVQVFARADAPARALPYGDTVLPSMRFGALALATAGNLNAIAARGVLTGSSPTQALDATFDVAADGSGTLGPAYLHGTNGSLYARASLNRPRGTLLALVDARAFAVPRVRATLDASVLAARRNGNAGAVGTANVRSAWGDARATGTLATIGNRIAGALSGTLTAFGSPGAADFGASIAGTPASPRLASAFVLSGGRYRNFTLNGNAGVVLANGTLAIRDAAMQVGPAFLAAGGSVAGLRAGSTLDPHYDLTARLQTADARALLAAVPHVPASLVQGSIDAGIRVSGSGASPSVSGTLDAPEGSVNGLAFRDARATIRGNRTRANLSNGRVTVGSTAIAFDGARSNDRTRVSVRAPYADLGDFNDFFDAGDTLAGNGRLSLAAELEGTHLAATGGEAFLAGARFRRIDLGDVAARWQSAGTSVGGVVAFGGPAGRIRAAGNVVPSPSDPMRSALDLTASARNLDLETWAPMLGFNLPVTGKLDADATIEGRYPDLALNFRAGLNDATFGRIPVQRFEIAVSGTRGHETIRSATLELPALTSVASGTFGLRPSDPVALVVHSTSSDVGPLLQVVSGKPSPVRAALDSTLHVDGTPASPRIADALAITSLTYGKLVIPRIAGTIAVSNRDVSVDDGEIDLQHGRVLASARVPVRLGRSIGPGSGALSASFTAQNVDVANAVALLPEGTKATGRIDGHVGVDGTIDEPRLNGSLALTGGTFSGPIERAPITDASGALAFAGTTATLQNVHAAIGGGSFAAQGTISLARLRAPADVAFNLRARADNAHVDMPSYLTGNITADVTVTHGGEPIAIGGSVEVSSARVPLTAFFNPGQSKKAPPKLPPIAFDNLKIAAGRDVRVQSANVDVGGTGAATLSGTLAAPKMSGEFHSTGGTLSFYRTFNLSSGSVAFNESSGVIPDVNAVATTFVTNPDTAIRLHVTGPVTNMNLALASDPPYNRQQILGLLVGAQQFGAVQGVASTRAGGQFSLPTAAGNVALGQLNTLFTRNMLEPLSSSVGSALGFTSLQLTTDIQTGLGLNAVKALGKNVTATATENIGYPRVESVAIEARPNIGESYRLRLFQAQGPTLFNLEQPQTIAMGATNINPITALTNIGGTGGVDFSYVRRFP